jgi:hypothetical protein
MGSGLSKGVGVLRLAPILRTESAPQARQGRRRGADVRAPGRERSSERAEEVEQILFLALVEAVELIDHRICLRRPEPAVAIASMGSDRVDKVARAAVVEEEDALAEAPQRGGPELVAPGRALQDVVGQPGAR